jgi:host factor-I protein
MKQVPESLSRRTMSERALADPFAEPGALNRGTKEGASVPSVQDVFLNSARRERLAVTVHLMNGQAFDARIAGFDRYAIVVDVDGTERLVFKHAIAVIEAARSGAGFNSPRA